MKKAIITFCVFALSFLTVAYTEGRSAKNRRNSNGQLTRSFLYADVKASKIGDIVTVLVMESASAQRNASTATSRSAKRNISSSIAPIKGSLGSSSAHNGSGSTSRSGEITATVPSMVMQVLPNGNLIIEGKRDLIINKDVESISVRGMVRPQDISPQNTVLSTQLADAQIRYEGDGWMSKQQRPGLLSRILDWLWIF